MNETIEICTSSGQLRIWESRKGWAWATANGSEGYGCESFDEAVAEAFEAQGLIAAEYGY